MSLRTVVAVAGEKRLRISEQANQNKKCKVEKFIHPIFEQKSLKLVCEFISQLIR